jgi:hypothetical protein
MFKYVRIYTYIFTHMYTYIYIYKARVNPFAGFQRGRIEFLIYTYLCNHHNTHIYMHFLLKCMYRARVNPFAGFQRGRGGAHEISPDEIFNMFFQVIYL